jgi:hypothetical protein
MYPAQAGVEAVSSVKSPYLKVTPGLKQPFGIAFTLKIKF